MADQVTPPPAKPPEKTIAQIVQELKDKANDWVVRFAGKVNHNPHLRVAQLIKPLVDKLSIEGATLTNSDKTTIAALPSDPVVINPSFKPEPVPTGLPPRPTAKEVGAENVKS